jgi:hypothetical protein
MHRLIELRATHNQHSALPPSIAALSQLRELHLRDNRIAYRTRERNRRMLAVLTPYAGYLIKVE